MSEQLSGNALIEACAKACGYEVETNVTQCSWLGKPPYNGILVDKKDGKRLAVWNPLASMSDCFDVLTAAEAKTGYITGLMHYPKTWECSFWQIGEDDPVVEHECDNPYEAICLAALKAIERCPPE